MAPYRPPAAVGRLGSIVLGAAVQFLTGDFSLREATGIAGAIWVLAATLVT